MIDTTIPIVTRRDMLGQDCLLCQDGQYLEAWWGFYDDDRLECNRCGIVVDRWLTKREMLEIQIDEVCYDDSLV